MTELMASVIIPTRNRPERLIRTLSFFSRQDVPSGDYEVVVVDDGSVPPVILPEFGSGPTSRVIRLEGSERSAARNAGAMAARGKTLILVDDDMTVGNDFVSSHLSAHRTWPQVLVVGSVRLPNEAMAQPFVRFRQRIEDSVVPEIPGPTPIRNFCAAANMSISRDLFQDIGGFDPTIVSGEDQDFALRHTALGRKIVFWPQASAVHDDNALDLRGYCRRAEWGSKHLVQFCRRHPNWPDNIERERVNSPFRWGGEPVSLNLKKLTKSILALTPFRETLLLAASVLERAVPNSRALERLYRVLLGVHIRRGYCQGAKCDNRDVDWGKPAARTATSD